MQLLCDGTEEMMRRCLLYLHVIYLVPLCDGIKEMVQPLSDLLTCHRCLMRIQRDGAAYLPRDEMWVASNVGRADRVVHFGSTRIQL